MLAEKGDAAAIAALAAAPKLPDGLASTAYVAFSQLSSERHMGMASGPIPWSKIQDWARDHGIGDPDGRDDLQAIVVHLDGIWLKRMAEKLKKPPPDAPRSVR